MVSPPFLLPIHPARLIVSLGACSETEQDTCLSLSLQEGEVLISSQVLYFFHLVCVSVVATDEMQQHPPHPAATFSSSWLLSYLRVSFQSSVFHQKRQKCLDLETISM